MWYVYHGTDVRVFVCVPRSSTADVEEVKDFVLTEDGTSAATPRHSTDLRRNILPVHIYIYIYIYLVG
jgi:hypothetical protein